MKKFLKCIISGVLVLSLLIAPLRNYSLAMPDSSSTSSSPIQSTETNIATIRWTLPAILVAAVSLAVAGTIGYFIGNHPLSVNLMVTAVSALVIYKHVPNIKRLLQQKELKFEDGAKKRKENEHK